MTRPISKEEYSSKLKYSQEEIDFIKNNYYGITHAKLAELVNEKFNTRRNTNSVRALCERLKLKNGIISHFEKGKVPYNKGKKWDEFLSKESQEKIRKTQFKKGNKNLRIYEEGDIIIKKYDGRQYKIIKINDKKWELLHRKIYEKYYGIKLSKNQLIFHLDGDTLNNKIDNLIMIETDELLKINKENNFVNNAEINKAQIYTQKLIKKLNKNKKE